MQYIDSYFLEENPVGTVHTLIKLTNGCRVALPALFFNLTAALIAGLCASDGLGEGKGSADGRRHSEVIVSALLRLFPVLVASVANVSEEGNRVGHFDSQSYGLLVPVLVGNVRLKYKLVLSFAHHALLAADGRVRNALVRVQRPLSVVERVCRNAHRRGRLE